MQWVIRNATVVTLNASSDVLSNAEIVVEDSLIVHVGKAQRRTRKNFRSVIDAHGCVVLPGLIHAHLHACQTLCRNQADGFQLLDWLKKRVWPFEAAHDAKSMRASADLTFLEMIRSGATAALDMGTTHHYEAVFESAAECGIRLVGGKAMMDTGDEVPAGLLESSEDSLDESLRLLRRWHGACEGRLRYAFAPRFVLSCTRELLERVGDESRRSGARIHTHASENPAECQVVREITGRDNIDYFHEVGMLGARTTLAHCIWLSEQEQQLLKTTGTHVCHCPSSNLKLASGVAKVPELIHDGINVALGADGAPCNNNLDIFTEMRLAALIHKPRTGPLGMNATTVLDMATRGGAAALGLEAEVGSIEVGKKADLITLDMSGPHIAPAGNDVVGNVVYAARSSDVRDVMVNGQLLMKNQKTLTLDEHAVLASARKEAQRMGKALKGWK